MALQADRLTRFALFSDLGPAQLAQIAAFSSRAVYPKGTLLLSCGEPVTGFYLVEYGRLKVFRQSQDGREQVLHIVEDGQSFAEVAALSLEQFPASALTLKDSALIFVPRGPFLALIAENADLARAMLSGQARWLRNLVDLTSMLMLEDVLARLARHLVRLAEGQGGPLKDGRIVPLEQSKTTIAAQIGTVPETLSRSFAKLEARGLLLREEKAIRILKARELLALAYPEI